MVQAEKIIRKTTHDATIDGIRDYILKNRLKVGDSLPSEHELCAALGISRNILREAMRYFRTLGFITSKSKTGAVIARLMPENPFEGYMPFIAAQGKCQAELVQACRPGEHSRTAGVAEAPGRGRLMIEAERGRLDAPAMGLVEMKMAREG